MDLQARVLKTYVSALGEDKSLTTLYGGVVGLTAMGPNVVRSILVGEHLHNIHNRLLVFNNTPRTNKNVTIKTEIKTEVAIKSEHVASSSGGDSSSAAKRTKITHGTSSSNDNGTAIISDEDRLSIEMCKAALLKALGTYLFTHS